MVTKLSSQEFNRDIGRVKRAAKSGPVIITDHGEPAYVLLRYDDYRRLVGSGATIRSLLDLPGVDGVEFDPPKLGGLFGPADLF